MDEFFLLVSYQYRPRVDGLVPKSDIHQGSAEFSHALDNLS